MQEPDLGFRPIETATKRIIGGMAETQKIPWNRISVEAAAVVVSILLAFSIDAWWQDRNEADLERRLLTALQVEFEQNDELLRKAREVYEGNYTDAVRTLELMDSGPADFDAAEFERLVPRLLLSRTFHLESGALDGLLASGELNLIRDERLRNRLAAWPSYVAEWSEEEKFVFSFVWENLIPYLSGWMRLRNDGPALPPFDNGESPPPIPVGADFAMSLDQLRASLEFDNLVYRRAQGMWYAMTDGEALRAQLTVILGLIEQNLDE